MADVLLRHRCHCVSPFLSGADGDAGLDPGAGWAGVGGAEDGEQILVASLLVLDVE